MRVLIVFSAVLLLSALAQQQAQNPPTPADEATYFSLNLPNSK